MTKEQLDKEIYTGKLFLIGIFKSVDPLNERSGTNAKGAWKMVTRKCVVEQLESGRTLDVELSDDYARDFVPPIKGTHVMCKIYHAASGKYGYEVRARSILPIED